jgi:N-acetylglucosamine-6-phosphate deacetylase
MPASPPGSVDEQGEARSSAQALAPFTIVGRFVGRSVGPSVEGAPPWPGSSGPRLRAAYVAPGFIDLQVNGGFGHEVGADPAALRALAAWLPRTGVTAFLPTLVSRSEADYAGCFAAVDAEMGAQARGERRGSARILGVHLEGPLLAPGRAGAHDAAAIEAADVAAMRRLADPARVRLVTLAPERAGAPGLIADLCARGVTVSLGHTEATFEQLEAGVEAGATLVTHVWNAMAPLHHRAPGAAGAALADDRVIAMAIADGVHLHPAAFRIAARAKGPGRLALVTDAISGAGLGPGESMLAGRRIAVDANSARLGDGTLAGSILTMDQAVRNAMQWGGLPLDEIVRAASLTPGAALAERPGLPVMNPDDVVLLDEDLTVRATFVGGHLAYVKDGDVDALRG